MSRTTDAAEPRSHHPTNTITASVGHHEARQVPSHHRSPHPSGLGFGRRRRSARGRTRICVPAWIDGSGATQRRLRTYATRGSRGAAALKRILAARGNAEPAGSVLEVKFIRLARGGHLPPFERQWRVLDGDGLVGCIDFAYPDLRLGVEVGGKGSHTGPAAEERDSRRHNRLTAQGWRMLYFGWSDVVNRPEHVLHVVRSEHARLRHAGGLHESQARDARA
jgi:very-short-patch-repair endonuclease